MASLVSLLMTDIVGSTRRWAADDAAMSADLELHDRLLREVVTGAGGTVVKHTGDGMLAVFDDPAAAVGAAASIQRAIGDTTWRHADGVQVRAAVHTGTVHRRDDDVFGTAVNRVARLLGVCPPGAVLTSTITAGLLAERGPEGCVLQPVGSVHLSGFTTPEEVHALVGAGLASVTDVGATIGSGDAAASLPPIDGDLVGRSTDLANIWDSLGRSPLVTLVGVGGMGKTRLALEVAQGATASFTDGVWWIDLTAATAEDAVVQVALAAIGAREAPGRTPLQAFCDRFTGRSALVVFDNCEHVLRAARDLVVALLNAAPATRVVCTSREALGSNREHIVPIGSLAVAEGVELFIERAMTVRPDLDVESNSSVIERICSRLDGIPLAVELAAARCRSMTPAEVDTRLGDRFRLLRSGRSGAERHRTLQAAVEWSYSLLAADERVVFDTLAVFAGGTLLDGLTAVTGLDEFDVLDIVDRLVARSMVVAAATPLGTRYRQLETLRQFAEDRLVERSELEALRARHLDWTVDLSTWIAGQRGTPGFGAAFCRFAAELDNFRVGVAHALSADQADHAHGIVVALMTSASFLPAWEVIDWVRPLPQGDERTTLAAICAAFAVLADLQRSPDRGAEHSAEFPMELVGVNSVVTLMRANILAAAGSRWREALALVDSIDTPTDLVRLRTGGLRLLATFLEQYERHLDDTEVDDLVARSGELVRRARQLGDELELGLLHALSAFALAQCRPHQAVEATVAAVAIAEPLGAHWLTRFARRARNLANGVLIASGEVAATSVVGSLRLQILAALEDHDYFGAGSFAFGTVRTLESREPATAALMARVWERERGMPMQTFLASLQLDPTVDWDEIDRRAASMSLPEAVMQVVAALDRLIAAESAGAEQGAG